MKNLICTIALTFVLSANLYAGALSPVLVTYQGELSQAGMPFTGQADLIFYLYDSEQNGNLLQTVPMGTTTNVTVAGGRFAVELEISEILPAQYFSLWLEIDVAVIAGSGNFTTLAPRQRFGASPYALYALDAGIDLSGFWDQRGNSGTNPNFDFLGTRDNAALEIRTNNSRVAFFGVESAFDGPRVVLGSAQNVVSAGGQGATISGGGDPSQVSCGAAQNQPCVNQVMGTYGTVSGGYGNLSSTNSVVGGGRENTASSNSSTVAGGYLNTASGAFSTVAGGLLNVASGLEIGSAGSTVGGGSDNAATGDSSTVAGGENNSASGDSSMVAGGFGNLASGDASMVAGGLQNTAGGRYSFAAGRQAKVRDAVQTGDFNGDEGTFIWADSTNADFASTGPDQFLVRAGGGVGLGTNNPNNLLHVQELNVLTAGIEAHVAQIENTQNSIGSDVLALKIGLASNPTAGNNFITFYRGGDVAVGRIHGNSTGGVTYKTSGADFAEYLLAGDSDLHPGEVVALRAGKLWKNTTKPERLFVISIAPGFVGNGLDSDEGTMVLAAFIGQVPVNVTGAVAPGDWLVASGNYDGLAVARSLAEFDELSLQAVVGRALTGTDGKNPGQVTALVGLPPTELVALIAGRQQQNTNNQETMQSELDSLRSENQQFRIALQEALLKNHRIENRLAAIAGVLGDNQEMVAVSRNQCRDDHSAIRF